MVASNYQRTPEALGMVPVIAGIDYVRSSFFSILAVQDLTVASPYLRTPELAAEIPLVTAGVPRTSQFAALVVYGEGERANITTRAWGFVFDGHSFYVLHLAQIGTFVCDLTTGLWAQFQTQGMAMWNAEVGLMWQGMIVAGDNQNPTLWNFDPDVQLDDDFKQIIHRATGIFPIRTRDSVQFDLFSVTVSHATPGSPNSTISLTYSDDDGKTFATADPVFTIVSADEPRDIQWSSLGAANQPGRIFNINDTGGMVRLSSADLTVRGQKNITPQGG